MKKIAVFFLALLALTATTVAAAALASNASLPVPTGRVQKVHFDAVSDFVQPLGDPVPGGGKAPT
jgi:hypothetical protein